MKRIPIPLWGVVTTAVLLIAGTAAPAQAYDIATTDVLATPAQAGSTLAFWLRDDGRALTMARPYTTRSRITPVPVSVGGPSPDGKPGLVPAIATAHRTTATATPTPTPTATPTSRNVNLPTTDGRAFFIGPGNRPYWCAATSVRSDNRNLVATAGHCVYDMTTGAAYRRWIFVPSPSQGTTPWGVYVGKQAFTHHDFAAYRDLDRDYAFVGVYNGVLPSRVQLPTPARYALFRGGLKYVTMTDGARAYVGVRLADAGRLGDRVGSQGLAYNLQVGNPLLVSGYPAGSADPTAETPLSRAYGRPFKAEDLPVKAGELVGIRSAAPIVSGSSWLASYNKTRGLGYLNGITIGLAGSTAISPYFDGELGSVYDAARRLPAGSIDLRHI